MPHLRRQQNQVSRQSVNNKSDLDRIARPMRPRDDISFAYAGKENNGPSGKISGRKHSTNVKGRASKASKFKTPKS